MKVRLVQCSAYLGDFDKNFEFHVEQIEDAIRNGVDLLVFPELSLSGYVLKDAIVDVGITAENLRRRFEEALSSVSDSKALEFVVGYVEESPSMRYHNSAAHFLLKDGSVSILYNHRKLNLPNYGMFEEQRYFIPGMELESYVSPSLGRCGMLICEDMWHLANPLILSLDGPHFEGVDFIIAISNSPTRGMGASNTKMGNLSLWNAMSTVYAKLLSTFVINCQRVGTEDGLIFSGGSAVFDPDGNIVSEAPMFDEHILDVEIDPRSMLRRARLRFLGRSADDFLRLNATLSRLSERYLLPPPRDKNNSA